MWYQTRQNFRNFFLICFDTEASIFANGGFSSLTLRIRSLSYTHIFLKFHRYEIIKKNAQYDDFQSLETYFLQKTVHARVE